MKLSIIIVSYNTCKLTLQTVTSLTKSIKSESPLANNYEIIVIDNDSHDQTIATLKALHLKQLKIVNSGENLGFGRANNLGFKYATGQLLLFLNSDTIVPAGSLEKMYTFYTQTLEKERNKRKKLGLLSATLRNGDGSIQPQGGDLPNLATIATTMFFLDDLPILGRLLPSVQHTGRRFHPSARAVEFRRQGWVAGTAVMCERELWEEKGGWDPEIFMYGEDQELCYRLHQEHYYHGILETALITHLGSASSSSAFAILGEIRGYLYFFRKYHPRQQWEWLKLILWLAAWLRVTIFTLVRPDHQRADIYTQAIGVIEQARY